MTLRIMTLSKALSVIQANAVNSGCENKPVMLKFILLNVRVLDVVIMNAVMLRVTQYNDTQLNTTQNYVSILTYYTENPYLNDFCIETLF
jgi:hypothetical protein